MGRLKVCVYLSWIILPPSRVSMCQQEGWFFFCFAYCLERLANMRWENVGGKASRQLYNALYDAGNDCLNLGWLVFVCCWFLLKKCEILLSFWWSCFSFWHIISSRFALYPLYITFHLFKFLLLFSGSLTYFFVSLLSRLIKS